MLQRERKKRQEAAEAFRAAGPRGAGGRGGGRARDPRGVHAGAALRGGARADRRRRDRRERRDEHARPRPRDGRRDAAGRRPRRRLAPSASSCARSSPELRAPASGRGCPCGHVAQVLEAPPAASVRDVASAPDRADVAAPTLRRCRRSSRSRTRSRPSWPGSPTACSTRCATGCACTIRLRGNQLTLEGDDEHGRRGARRHRRARRAGRGRPRDRPGHRRRGARRARAGRRTSASVFDDVVWRHRGKKIAPKTVTQKQYVDAIRKCTVTFGIGPAGTGKTYLAMALAVAALSERAGRPHHPHAPRGRGRRAARLPARRHAREGRPVPAAALRRALRHARPRPARRLHGARHDRGRAARVHARPHAQRLVHHPRRGAEHEPRADADVPDAPRLRLEGRRHRRRHPDRPAARAGVRD